jgi:hypothetical protein
MSLPIRLGALDKSGQWDYGERLLKTLQGLASAPTDEPFSPTVPRTRASTRLV